MSQTDPPGGSARPGSPGQLVSVEVADHGQNLVLTVAGDIDLLTTPHLREALTRALEGRPPVLVVDLGNVKFLASAGLAALVEAHQSGDDQTQLRIVATTTATLRPLQLTGLHRELACTPASRTLSAAGDDLRSIRHAQESNDPFEGRQTGWKRRGRAHNATHATKPSSRAT